MQRELCKQGWLNRDDAWGLDVQGSKEPYDTRGPGSPDEGALLGDFSPVEKHWYCLVLSIGLRSKRNHRDIVNNVHVV